MSEKHLKQPNKAPSRKAEKPPKEQKPPKEKPVRFRQEETPEVRLSRKDRIRVILSLIAVVLLLAAAVVLWLMRDTLREDPLAFITAPKAPTAREEYFFDTSSGQCFASVGSGFAVATSSSLELLDENGRVAASRLIQMETPAITACGDYAVFYDIGGLSIAAAYFDGTVKELTPAGGIFSASVSSGGYLAVVTESAGYRGLVTVYDTNLDPVYQWFSSSAWVISAEISPDNRSLAVLSYTASGSEVRLFDLNRDSQKAVFSVTDTILLDTHWFSTTQLCAYSTDNALFFDNSGAWVGTYDFKDRFLIDCAYGDGFAVFALSPYRAGTTSTLVSLDAAGNELGTAEIQSELVSLDAAGTEVLALCPDSVSLYSSTLTEKGVLTGLTGFKCSLIRSRGEALLIASGYAEVHTF